MIVGQLGSQHYRMMYITESGTFVETARGGKVQHGGLFERLVVCGDRHPLARDCRQGSLHPPGSQSAAHDL